MGSNDERVAVIGVAGRFPGAPDVETFWSGLIAGTVSVERLSDEMLRAAGVPEQRIADPNYVRFAPLIGDASQFDAGLFGFTRREAELRDPQQRIFLEVAYSAFEHAAIDPWRTGASVGVFASGGANYYAEQNLRRNAKVLRSFGDIAIQTSNHGDYVASLVSYKLNLRGPALTIATACSGSLVAVHQACQALRNGDCDIALAGGVQLEMPYGGGHLWVRDGILTRSGICRPFDAGADGTLFGNGAGAVVLKPLADARRDGDRVLAVIRGSAINNDGDQKVGFTAPSVDGQFAAIYEALVVSDVDPVDIGYLEGHGTGTSVGDPIEVAALTKAFGTFTDRRRYCVLSSVKGNIGHLGPASGIAGLIKAVLSVARGIAPGTAGYRSPNPLMDIDRTPFLLGTATGPWPLTGPRLAGVSSFGVGGTNAHVVIEDGGAAEPSEPSRRTAFVLPLAAASAESLRRAAEGVAEYVTATGDELPDIAHTLRRRPLHLPYRRAVVGADRDAVVDALTEPADVAPTVGDLRTVFLFPGQGAQYAGMAREPHAAEPVFRREFDRCLEMFGPPVAAVLRECLLSDHPDAIATLRHTEYTQPALFAIEWALAALWSHWGVEPAAMLGHSIGEIVAATLAGVFDLPAAARLVVARGRFLAESPAGRMITVPLSAQDAETILADRPDVWLSADSGPRACVVAGLPDAVGLLETDLAGRGLRCVPLDVGRAFHTPLTEDAGRRLIAFLADVPRSRPSRRWVSNVTGDWITDEDAVSVEYWGRQISAPVRLRQSFATLAALEHAVALEAGPGTSLTQLARRQLPAGQARPVASLPRRDDATGSLYRTAADLWQAGAPIDWSRVAVDERRQPVSAPGYQFDRQSYWIKPDEPGPATESARDDRLTVPCWTESPPVPSADAVAGRHWVVTGSHGSEVSQFLDRLLAQGALTASAPAIEKLVRELPADGPVEILHLGMLGERPAGLSDLDAAGHWLDCGFRPVRRLLADLARYAPGRDVRITCVASDLWNVSGAERVEPGKAPLVALLDVAVKENESLRCRVVDVRRGTDFLDHITSESAVRSERVAVRGHRRWTPSHRAVTVEDAMPDVRDGQVWVITGGFGALGLVAAERLAELAAVRMALLGRRGLPPRDRWATPDSLDDGQREAVEAVRRMEKAGATVLVLDADVADRAAMARALDQTRTELGQVHGVLHAAGVAGDGMLAVRPAEAADAVLRPKVLGTEILDELTGDEPELFVLFSSMAVITNPFGLADYAAANAYLDAFAQERTRRRPGRTLAINWPSWAGAGMAVNAAGGRSRFHPLAAGAEPEIEVVPRTGSAQVFAVRLDPSCWLVAEHRIAGTPVLPGTGYLDLVLRAARTLTPGAVALTDVAFTAPLAVTGPVELRLTFTQEGPGWRFRAETPAGDAWTPHCVGRLEPVSGIGGTHDLAALREQHGHARTGAALNGDGAMVSVGARWGNVSSVAGADGSVLLDLDLPQRYAADTAQSVLHAALLDRATAFQMDGPKRSRLPLAYRRIVVYQPLPASVTALLVEPADQPSGVELRDVLLLDRAGREVAVVEGFTMREVDRGAVENSLRHNGSTDTPLLDVADGVRLLDALLATDLGPQVLVTVDGLARSLERADGFTAAAVKRSRGAPRAPIATDDSTRRLGQVWSDILGVAVSPEDDFFELGGDSLAAVQMVEQVRVEFGTELAIAELFEHRTLAEFAALVRESVGG